MEKIGHLITGWTNAEGVHDVIGDWTNTKAVGAILGLALIAMGLAVIAAFFPQEASRPEEQDQPED